MKNLFFKPYIGQGFTAGQNRKSILVVGASFYCDKMTCPFYSDCTSVDKKDSSEYDDKCPFCDGTKLSDSPEDELTSGNKRYSTFANAVIKACDLDMTRDEFLSRISFTNYVQFMLPGNDRKTEGKTTARDYDAFKETVRLTAPDMIVVWGSEASADIKKEAVDPDSIESTKGYYFHIEIDGRTIPVLNTEHPANWFVFFSDENLDAIAKYLGGVLKMEES